MSERPVENLDNVGDDSSDTASNDATDTSQESTREASEQTSDDTSGRDEDLMPDLADNSNAGATESNPN